jgi:hypothetical protein
MKRYTKLTIAAAALAAIAAVDPAFSLNHSARHSVTAADARPVSRSVIVVHTEHGVVVLQGAADSWKAVENALFVADSIADVQLVNNEVALPIADEQLSSH